MEPFDPRERVNWARCDALVAATPGIDPFCSLPAWGLAWHSAFAPEREVCGWSGEESALLFAASERGEQGLILEPLEVMWGLGSPLIGPRCVAGFARFLTAWPLGVLLTGIPTAAVVSLEAALPPGRVVYRHGSARRMELSLAGGVAGVLQRRGREMRHTLRQAERRARRARIEFSWEAPEAVLAFPELYAEILTLERESWKGKTGVGVDQGAMAEFYRTLLPWLIEAGQFRLLRAWQGGEAVGYLHGAVIGRHFRGLQFSYAAPLRALGLGNAMQLAAMERLTAEGIERYDLGSEVPYKRRWADPDAPEQWVLYVPPGPRG